jgi:uncharacterized protein YbcI
MGETRCPSDVVRCPSGGRQRSDRIAADPEGSPAGATAEPNADTVLKGIGGELNAALVQAVVRIHHDYMGRGPSTARAFFRENIVVVVVERVMTAPERSLAGSGRQDGVRDVHRDLLEVMRADLTVAVEDLTNRRVTALMSDIHVESDIASLVFVLDQSIHTQPADGSGAIAEHGPAVD